MTLIAVLVPRQFDVRLFDVPREEIIYGLTRWIGTASIAVNELGEANITGIARVDGKNSANIGPPVLSELRKYRNAKAGLWTKNGRIVHTIFTENCSPEEVRRFRTIIDAERAVGLNVIQEPEMPHTKQTIDTGLKHAAGQHGFQAKNATLFDHIHGMISASVAESKALGATDVELAVFANTQHVFEALKPTLIRAHLNDDAAKAEVFKAIYDLVTWSVDQAKAAGATDAELAPFTSTQALFNSDKAAILATNMA